MENAVINKKKLITKRDISRASHEKHELRGARAHEWNYICRKKKLSRELPTTTTRRENERLSLYRTKYLPPETGTGRKYCCAQLIRGAGGCRLR